MALNATVAVELSSPITVAGQWRILTALPDTGIRNRRCQRPKNLPNLPHENKKINHPTENLLVMIKYFHIVPHLSGLPNKLS